MNKEYIARISYGKDSMKMLDVIHTRGLPLHRITTTDVWATDTIPAWLPPLTAFRNEMDIWIYRHYGIKVEHLCATNPDGSKRTYEQMFYHVPIRRSQIVQVERERERESSPPDRFADSPICGIRGAKLGSRGMPSYRQQGSIKGFPGTVGVKWCQKLKNDWVTDTGISRPNLSLVQETQNRQGQNHGFPTSPRRARTEISWNIWGSLRMSPSASGS